MAGTIASLLTDFTPQAGKETAGLAILRPVKPPREEAPQEQPRTRVEIDADLTRQVEARVRAEERKAAEARLEQALVEERARYEEELGVQRTLWIEQQAEQLAAQIAGAVARLETILSERVANVLKPFLEDAFREQSIAELKSVLATLLVDGSSRTIKVTGPGDLLARIQETLDPHVGMIEFSPSDDVEVSVVAQDTTIQTQLAQWTSRLEQALKVE